MPTLDELIGSVSLQEEPTENLSPWEYEHWRQEQGNMLANAEAERQVAGAGSGFAGMATAPFAQPAITAAAAEPPPVAPVPQLQRSAQSVSVSGNRAGPVSRAPIQSQLNVPEMAVEGVKDAQATADISMQAAGAAAGYEEGIEAAKGTAAQSKQDAELDYRDAMRSLEKERDASIARRLEAMQRFRDNMGTVEPNRLYNDMDGFQRFMFVTAAALNGMLAAHQGRTTNEVLEMADKMADRDVKAQMADLDTKQAVYANMQAELDTIIGEHNRDAVVETALKASRLEGIQRAFEVEAASRVPGRVQANYLAAAAAAKGKVDASWQEVRKLTIDNENKRLDRNLDAWKAAESENTERNKYQAQIKLARDLDASKTGKTNKLSPMVPIGVVTGFTDKEGNQIPAPGVDAKSQQENQELAHDMSLGAQQQLRALKELQSMNLDEVAALASINPTSPHVVRVQTLANQWLDGKRKTEGMGLGSGVSDKDMRIFMSGLAAGDYSRLSVATGTIGTVMSEQIPVAIDDVYDQMNQWIKGKGDQTQYVQDAKGKVHRIGHDYTQDTWKPPSYFDKTTAKYDQPLETADKAWREMKPLRAEDASRGLDQPGTAQTAVVRLENLAKQVKRGTFDNDLLRQLQTARRGREYAESLGAYAKGELKVSAPEVEKAAAELEAAVTSRHEQISGGQYFQSSSDPSQPLPRTVPRIVQPLDQPVKPWESTDDRPDLVAPFDR